MKHQRQRSKVNETPFGHALREAIAPKGWTVGKAAAHMGVSHSTLHAILNGRSKMSLYTATLFADTFGQTPEYWLGLQKKNSDEMEFYHD